MLHTFFCLVSRSAFLCLSSALPLRSGPPACHTCGKLCCRSGGSLTPSTSPRVFRMFLGHGILVCEHLHVCRILHNLQRICPACVKWMFGSFDKRSSGGGHEIHLDSCPQMAFSTLIVHIITIFPCRAAMGGILRQCRSYHPSCGLRRDRCRQRSLFVCRNRLFWLLDGHIDH